MADHNNADGKLENGLPPSRTPPTPAAADTTDSLQDSDMEDWRKAFGNNISPAVKEFLQYRHRGWELGIEADLIARQKARAAQTRKP